MIDFKCECGLSNCNRHIIIAGSVWDYWCGVGSVIHASHRREGMNVLHNLGNNALVVDDPSKSDADPGRAFYAA